MQWRDAPIQHWHCVTEGAGFSFQGLSCVSDGGRGDPIWGQRTNISASRSCVGYSPGASIAHGKLTLADGGSDQALWRWVGSDAAGHERARQPNSSLASQSSLPDFPLASDQKLSRCYPPFQLPIPQLISSLSLTLPQKSYGRYAFKSDIYESC